MPMALIIAASKDFEARALRQASLKYSHQLSGDCSAQPLCRERMAASLSGNCAAATGCPEAASTTETLMEEVPMSMPSSSIVLITILFTVGPEWKEARI